MVSLSLRTAESGLDKLLESSHTIDLKGEKPWSAPEGATVVADTAERNTIH